MNAAGPGGAREGLQGLCWEGRWGASKSSPICVFAPYLVLLEAALGDSIEADPRWHQLLEAVGSSLCAELAGNGVLAAVHWKPRQAGQSHRRVMAALILADPAVCHTLRQQHWSRVRRFLRDQAFVRWKDGLDTADPERSKGHCRQLLDALQLRRVESPGFALELPVEWLEGALDRFLDGTGMAEKPHARCSAVRAQCPWERFFQHFGPLSLLERVLTEPGRAVLLACFQDPAAAEDAWAEGLGAGFPRRGVSIESIEAIYECLAGRCLYFPWRETCTDCFPVLCALRDYDTLKAQLYRQEQLQDTACAGQTARQTSVQMAFRISRSYHLQKWLGQESRVKATTSTTQFRPSLAVESSRPRQDEEPAYLLRRLGERPPKPSPPEAILVTSSRGTWRCGREGVEISLRAAHVSKVHAVLELSFAELYEEVYEKRRSRLQVVDKDLVRNLRVIKVWLCVSILNCKHVLVVKNKQKEGAPEIRELRTLSMQMREDWGSPSSCSATSLTALWWAGVKRWSTPGRVPEVPGFRSGVVHRAKRTLWLVGQVRV
eukprot:g13556.t1